MRVPDEIKKCVVFFGLKHSEKVDFKATGFFVHIKLDETRYFIYLVTAKHVAKKLEGKDFVIRVNTKDGKSVGFHSPANTAIKWHYHPTDEAADVAVFQWLPPSEANADYMHLPAEMFLTKETLIQNDIGIGDEVCIIGLFTFHEGYSKNHPMLRIGNIAMIPDEPVETDDGKVEAYLIEARSIGGLSGSPVFVVREAQYPDMKIHREWILMGLVQGHWKLDGDKINDLTELDANGKPHKVNMGIAIVTPAQKILDILSCEELFSIRKKRRAAEQKLKHPTND